MKFDVNLDEFMQAINRAMPAIPPKSTLPVLEHFKLEASENILIITSTDQEITIKTNVAINCEIEGAVLVPARKLSDIMKALGKNDRIKFSSNLTNFSIDIEAGFGKYEMKGLDPDEYIDLPVLFNDSVSDDETGEGKVKIPKNEVISLTEKTAFAVSHDEFRLAMTGVLFQFRSNYINAVSTDSYRLVKCVYKQEESNLPEELDIIFPIRIVEILRKTDNDVIFSFIKSSSKITHIRFEIGNTVYISRIIDEKFPPYESVIPDNNNISLTVNKNEFLAAIKRVAIFTNHITKEIKLNLSQNSILIEGEDEDSGTKADEKVDCTLSGEPITIGFNFKYLEDALNYIDTSEDNTVTLTFSQPSRPVLMMPTENNDKLLMLIMPVRIS